MAWGQAGTNIEQEAIRAFTTFTKFSRDNNGKGSTFVVIDELEGGVKRASLILHRTTIAWWTTEGPHTLHVNTGGWDTLTTRRRLDAIPGVSIGHHKNVLYLNGYAWDGHTVNVADHVSEAQAVAAEKAAEKAREEARLAFRKSREAALKAARPAGRRRAVSAAA